MTPEQREMAIWGGLTAVLVIACWIWLGIRGGSVDEQGRQVDALHVRYGELFPAENDGRLPIAEAHAVLEQQRDEQAAVLDAIEAQAVWPGSGGEGVPPEFQGIALGDSIGIQITDYVSVLDQISRTLSRLRQRADSLGVELPVQLPLEASGAVSADNALQRQVQMAQVCAYAALLDIAMDADIDNFDPLQLGTPWSSADGVYASIPVSTRFECSYESADVLMRSLRSNAFGLGLDQIFLEYNDDGSFLVSLTVRLVVYQPSEWGLSVRTATSVSGTGGSAGGGLTPRRRGGR